MITSPQTWNKKSWKSRLFHPSFELVTDFSSIYSWLVLLPRFNLKVIFSLKSTFLDCCFIMFYYFFFSLVTAKLSKFLDFCVELMCTKFNANILEKAILRKSYHFVKKWRFQCQELSNFLMNRSFVFKYLRKIGIHSQLKVKI